MDFEVKDQGLLFI